ncbi:uncharacterized protein LTR77_005883 [Saxophila tyrrhenica]|uniref:Uncharacterized protein n=1 Tax=Saxophila tyrrhenica TaxID=1690608 RepID=A0AAV9PAG8_9PEZI|nr:hypothetical protein LTR77_005883 [Saxophila tyrrhenica]
MQLSAFVLAMLAGLTLATPIDQGFEDDDIWLEPYELDGDSGTGMNMTILMVREDGPKMNEYAGHHCGGELLYHHAPARQVCVGMSGRTQSVYIVNGIGDSRRVHAYFKAGQCDGGPGGPGTSKIWDVDVKNCFRVKHPAQHRRIRDVKFVEN